MNALVFRLTHDDNDALSSMWQSATNLRRHQLGLTYLTRAAPALSRPGSFGVGLYEGSELVSAAVAMPARGDDGHSDVNVPGLAHISSVVTETTRWGKGHAGRAVRALMTHATRRGYARVQLWTHLSNEGARRLYEREGFRCSGREKVDDYGEVIVHYLRELPSLEVKSRPAARLVCLDALDRVLLMRWRDPVDGHVLREPPGGGIEDGESPRDAVVREWYEETGLSVPTFFSDATRVARDTVWCGTRWVGDEHFFLGRLADSPRVQPGAFTDVEIAGFLGSAWVGRRELDRLDDPVEPDLLPVLRRLTGVAP